jgi:hypothetical protein
VQNKRIERNGIIIVVRKSLITIAIEHYFMPIVIGHIWIIPISVRSREIIITIIWLRPMKYRSLLRDLGCTKDNWELAHQATEPSQKFLVKTSSNGSNL